MYHVSLIHSLSNFIYPFAWGWFFLAAVTSSAGNMNVYVIRPLLSSHPSDIFSEWEGWVLW